MVKKSLFIIPMLIVAIGCNNEEASNTGLVDEGNDTFYSHETNLNVNNFRNLSTQRSTLSADQDKIRIAVNNASGLNPQWVSIVGNTAYVHVNLPADYSKDRKDKLEERILEAVTSAVPRYTIRLKIDENS